MVRIFLISSLVALQFIVTSVSAGDSVQEQRHDLMEEARDAAKTIGGMLKGEQPFDAEAAMASFEDWARVAATAGDLFPEGSETGYGTEARETVWTDREGFNKSMMEFSQAANAAIEAAPQDVEALKAAAGPVFKTCKGCHEGYRVDDEN